MKTMRLLLLSAWLLWGACQSSTDSYRLSAERFNELLADRSVQLLDVRTTAEYSEGHIAGAINLNVMDERFDAAAKELLSADAPVAIYCKSGRRSRKAARQLHEAGFQVFELDKGLQGWGEAGYEVVK